MSLNLRSGNRAGNDEILVLNPLVFGGDVNIEKILPPTPFNLGDDYPRTNHGNSK
jgi:hypothetical protein